jgi:hypothetical protein
MTSSTPATSEPSAQCRSTLWPRRTIPTAKSQITDWAPPVWAGRNGVTGDATTAIFT